MLRYSVVLMPDESSYAVVVPALPGCVTQGDSVEDALERARDLIPLWIAGLADAGEDVPVEEGPALLCVLDVEEPQSSAAPQQTAGATPRA
jgi:predicted RNase H-like HicB family nuclease